MHTRNTSICLLRDSSLPKLGEFLQQSVADKTIPQDVLARLNVSIGDGVEVLAQRLVEGQPAGADKLPTELRIIPFGQFNTSKGKFLFDEVSAALVLSWQKEWGNKFSSDYEHATFNQNNVEAPASSWYQLEMRQDGLYAVGLEWTKRAGEMLLNREYRYFSPAFIHDIETGRVVAYLNFALTNIPATFNMAPIMASLGLSLQSRAAPPPAPVPPPSAVPPSPSRKEPNRMEALLVLLGLSSVGLSAEQQQVAVSQALNLLRDFKVSILNALSLPATANVEDVLTALRQQRDMRHNLLNALGLPTTTTSEALLSEVSRLKTNGKELGEQVAALSRFQAEVQTATGRANPDEARVSLSQLGKLAGHVLTVTGKKEFEEQVAALSLLQTKAAEADTLRSQVETLSKDKQDRALDELIRAAQDEGRVTPGNLPQALSMKEFGAKALTTFLAGLPKSEAARPPATPPAPPSPSGTPTTPPPEFVAKARAQLGIKDDAAIQRAWNEHHADAEKARKANMRPHG